MKFLDKHLVSMLCFTFVTNLSFGQTVNENPLEKLSQPFALRVKERSDRYYDEQKKKANYDTVGLFQFRTDIARIKAERKNHLISFIKKNPKNPFSLDVLQDVIGYLPEDIKQYKKLYDKLDITIKKNGTWNQGTSIY